MAARAISAKAVNVSARDPVAGETVAVYDGSLSEWARDESLPMDVGEG